MLTTAKPMEERSVMRGFLKRDSLRVDYLDLDVSRHMYLLATRQIVDPLPPISDCSVNIQGSFSPPVPKTFSCEAIMDSELGSSNAQELYAARHAQTQLLENTCQSAVEATSVKEPQVLNSTVYLQRSKKNPEKCFLSLMLSELELAHMASAKEYDDNAHDEADNNPAGTDVMFQHGYRDANSEICGDCSIRAKETGIVKLASPRTTICQEYERRNSPTEALVCSDPILLNCKENQGRDTQNEAKNRDATEEQQSPTLKGQTVEARDLDSADPSSSAEEIYNERELLAIEEVEELQEEGEDTNKTVGADTQRKISQNHDDNIKSENDLTQREIAREKKLGAEYPSLPLYCSSKVSGVDGVIGFNKIPEKQDLEHKSKQNEELRYNWGTPTDCASSEPCVSEEEVQELPHVWIRPDLFMDLCTSVYQLAKSPVNEDAAVSPTKSSQHSGVKDNPDSMNDSINQERTENAERTDIADHTLSDTLATTSDSKTYGERFLSSVGNKSSSGERNCFGDDVKRGVGDILNKERNTEIVLSSGIRKIIPRKQLVNSSNITPNESTEEKGKDVNELQESDSVDLSETISSRHTDGSEQAVTGTIDNIVFTEQSHQVPDCSSSHSIIVGLCEEPHEKRRDRKTKRHKSVTNLRDGSCVSRSGLCLDRIMSLEVTGSQAEKIRHGLSAPKIKPSEFKVPSPVLNDCSDSTTSLNYPTYGLPVAQSLNRCTASAGESWTRLQEARSSQPVLDLGEVKRKTTPHLSSNRARATSHHNSPSQAPTLTPHSPQNQENSSHSLLVSHAMGDGLSRCSGSFDKTAKYWDDPKYTGKNFESISTHEQRHRCTTFEQANTHKANVRKQEKKHPKQGRKKPERRMKTEYIYINSTREFNEARRHIALLDRNLNKSPEFTRGFKALHTSEYFNPTNRQNKNYNKAKFQLKPALSEPMKVGLLNQHTLRRTSMNARYTILPKDRLVNVVRREQFKRELMKRTLGFQLRSYFDRDIKSQPDYWEGLEKLNPFLESKTNEKHFAKETKSPDTKQGYFLDGNGPSSERIRSRLNSGGGEKGDTCDTELSPAGALSTKCVDGTDPLTCFMNQYENRIMRTLSGSTCTDLRSESGSVVEGQISDGNDPTVKGRVSPAQLKSKKHKTRKSEKKRPKKKDSRSSESTNRDLVNILDIQSQKIELKVPVPQSKIVTPSAPQEVRDKEQEPVGKEQVIEGQGTDVRKKDTVATEPSDHAQVKLDVHNKPSQKLNSKSVTQWALQEVRCKEQGLEGKRKKKLGKVGTCVYCGGQRMIEILFDESSLSSEKRNIIVTTFPYESKTPQTTATSEIYGKQGKTAEPLCDTCYKRGKKENKVDYSKFQDGPGTYQSSSPQTESSPPTAPKMRRSSQASIEKHIKRMGEALKMQKGPPQTEIVCKKLHGNNLPAYVTFTDKKKADKVTSEVAHVSQKPSSIVASAKSSRTKEAKQESTERLLKDGAKNEVRSREERARFTEKSTYQKLEAPEKVHSTKFDVEPSTQRIGSKQKLESLLGVHVPFQSMEMTSEAKDRKERGIGTKCFYRADSKTEQKPPRSGEIGKGRKHICDQKTLTKKTKENLQNLFADVASGNEYAATSTTPPRMQYDVCSAAYRMSRLHSRRCIPRSPTWHACKTISPCSPVKRYYQSPYQDRIADICSPFLQNGIETSRVSKGCMNKITPPGTKAKPTTALQSLTKKCRVGEPQASCKTEFGVAARNCFGFVTPPKPGKKVSGVGAAGKAAKKAYVLCTPALPFPQKDVTGRPPKTPRKKTGSEKKHRQKPPLESSLLEFGSIFSRRSSTTSSTITKKSYLTDFEYEKTCVLIKRLGFIPITRFRAPNTRRARLDGLLKIKPQPREAQALKCARENLVEDASSCDRAFVRSLRRCIDLSIAEKISDQTPRTNPNELKPPPRKDAATKDKTCPQRMFNTIAQDQRPFLSSAKGSGSENTSFKHGEDSYRTKSMEPITKAAARSKTSLPALGEESHKTTLPSIQKRPLLVQSDTGIRATESGRKVGCTSKGYHFDEKCIASDSALKSENGNKSNSSFRRTRISPCFSLHRVGLSEAISRPLPFLPTICKPSSPSQNVALYGNKTSGNSRLRSLFSTSNETSPRLHYQSPFETNFYPSSYLRAPPKYKTLLPYMRGRETYSKVMPSLYNISSLPLRSRQTLCSSYPTYNVKGTVQSGTNYR